MVQPRSVLLGGAMQDDSGPTAKEVQLPQGFGLPCLARRRLLPPWKRPGSHGLRFPTRHGLPPSSACYWLSCTGCRDRLRKLLLSGPLSQSQRHIVAESPLSRISGKKADEHSNPRAHLPRSAVLPDLLLFLSFLFNLASQQWHKVLVPCCVESMPCGVVLNS